MSRQAQAALDASGVRYTIPADGKIDYEALGRAIAARWPKINAYLAAN